jgi:hypothetical protein
MLLIVFCYSVRCGKAGVGVIRGSDLEASLARAAESAWFYCSKLTLTSALVAFFGSVFAKAVVLAE